MEKGEQSGILYNPYLNRSNRSMSSNASLDISKPNLLEAPRPSQPSLFDKQPLRPTATRQNDTSTGLSKQRVQANRTANISKDMDFLGLASFKPKGPLISHRKSNSSNIRS